MNEETKVVDVEMEETVETIEVDEVEVEETKLGAFKRKSKEVWKKAKPFVFTAIGTGLVVAVGAKVLGGKDDDDEYLLEDSSDVEDYDMESVEDVGAVDEEPVTFIEDEVVNEETND